MSILLSLPPRISSKIIEDDLTGCWLWQGTLEVGNYGRVYMNGRMQYAHRVVYELLVGSIPIGFEIDHLCREPQCVNPEHLQPVTHRENMRRKEVFMSNLKVSHSQLQVWSACEKKWSFSYQLGLQPKVKAHYFSTGDFTHKGLEVVYNSRMAGLSWDETILKLIANWKETAPAMMQENIESFKKATRVLKRYVAQFAPKADAGIRILGVETHFSVDLPTPNGNNVTVEGYIDLIVEINGVMFAWDHKTIGSSTFWSQEEAMLDPQFGIYTLALREMGYPIKGFIINQINTYDYAKFDEQPNEKLFKRLETYRTDEHLRGIADNVGKMADELIEKREGRKPLIRHLSKTTCKGCIFRQPCLYELKGIDVTNLLAADYVKRAGRDGDDVPEEMIEDISAYELKF